eukprot:CAMPEP_0180652878 /NCGR_PEP_ID=MMETSP1037_2-20121125/53753_1 /TAXON_ID=632150 /ORGANISM="Azadinium spinosum, Strain 3D9" /LENGTH=215 /DNA_ID=CAMNT_0022678823 /DNA_START=24 /DNA_END=668 /DNA_ORIENTATION=+
MSKGGPPDISGMTSLKVDCSGSIPEKWNVEDLRSLFEKYGDVGDVFIPREKYSDKSRGFAFVRFFHQRDAQDAIKDLNGYKLQGSMLTVTKANRSRDEARSENMSEARRGLGLAQARSPVATTEGAAALSISAATLAVIAAAGSATCQVEQWKRAPPRRPQPQPQSQPQSQPLPADASPVAMLESVIQNLPQQSGPPPPQQPWPGQTPLPPQYAG